MILFGAGTFLFVRVHTVMIITAEQYENSP